MDQTSYEVTLANYKDDIDRISREHNLDKLYFQQDNASCHTCKDMTKEINNTFSHVLAFWPPNSPDLSPIENIWAMLKHKASLKNFNTSADLQTYIQGLWNRIPRRFYQNMCDSFLERCKYVLKHKGRKFKRTRQQTQKWKKQIWIQWNDDPETRIVFNDRILRSLQIKGVNSLLKNNLRCIKERLKRALAAH